MPSPSAPQQNKLLAALSSSARERVYPHLRLVQMTLGEVLCEPGAVLRNVYFPTDSVISQVYVTADGASTQVSSVGNDGAHTLLTQTAQTAVCNRYHSVDQQLCWWLLVALDRVPSNRLTITQELIAGILGVRRESVTQAAGKLQKAGAIAYGRGHLTVIDRLLLERLCCECYEVVRKETDRLSRCRSLHTNPIGSNAPREIVVPQIDRCAPASRQFT